MTIRPSEGWDPPELPDPLAGYRICRSGAWTIVAVPHRLELARCFLGPVPVDGLLKAMEAAGGEGGDDGEGALSDGPRRPAAPRGRGGVLEIDGGGGAPVILKALRRGGLPARLRGGFYGHARLMAELAVVEEAYGRGIPTPAPAFGASGRREDGSEVGLLATDMIPGAFSLGAILDGSAWMDPALRGGARRRGDPEPGAPLEGARRPALRAAGAATCRAHDMGLDHGDLNIGNILVGRQGEGWRAVLIDLGLSGLGGPLDPVARASNLVRLLRSAEKHLGDDPRRARDAAAFLHGYLTPRPDPHRHRRRELLAAIRRRLPSLALHRLGWKLLGRG